MDNRSSLIPICLILTSGASLRASLSALKEKLDSPLRFIPHVILTSLELTSLPITFLVVVCFIVGNVRVSASRTRCQNCLLVFYIVTTLLHRPPPFPFACGSFIWLFFALSLSCFPRLTETLCKNCGTSIRPPGWSAVGVGFLGRQF